MSWTSQLALLSLSVGLQRSLLGPRPPRLSPGTWASVGAWIVGVPMLLAS